ncbi:CYTH domain-containing protein [Candidatus Gracilibacteria bacterium]|nr:CYTH domain-containing protein [Candidatus Gracilibacteria bacterium]
MILEKEIKILEIDKQEVTQKLLSLGAEKTFEGYIHDIYYDFPTEGDEKNKMHANKRMFRIRKKGEEHIYTIKNKRKKIGKKEDVVAKDEHEMEITDIESFSSVLERYGMEKIREKKKHRVSYKLGEIEFDFDLYEGIPELLEIEGPDGDTIREWIEKLGLTQKKQLLGGSKKLFEHYGIEYSYF